MKTLLSNFIREEKGATVVEYGIILALVVLVVITIILALEGMSKKAFNSVGNTVKDFGKIE